VSKQVTLEGALVGTGFPYRENSPHRRLHGDAQDGHAAGGRHPPAGRGGPRPGLRRRGPHRRVLGDRAARVGHSAPARC
jgi:hypothetical protein